MKPEKEKITLMDRARIERTIKRISWQVAEKAKEKPICIVGLNERGYAVAEEISGNLRSAYDNEITLLSLDVDHAGSEAETIRKEHDFNQSVVLLVDDVIFSGKTMFTALQKLLSHPDHTVYTAVLVDRGNRSLPVASEFVGMEIPTKPKEHVEVTLRNGKADEVFLYKK